VADDRIIVHSATASILTLRRCRHGSRRYSVVIDWQLRLMFGAAWRSRATFLLKLSFEHAFARTAVSMLPAR